MEKPIFLVQNADRAITSKDFKHLQPNQLRVHNQFFTLQGEGPFAGQQAHFLRLAGCNYGAKDQYCQFCFPEDHYITTVKGRQLFKDVKVGDELFALDKNGDVATTKVVKKLVREVEIADMVVVEYRMPGGRGTKKLVCTADHPFHTTTRGFVPAKELKRSDEIYHVTKNALMSAFRKENNPAWDPEVIVRGRQTFKSRYESGEIPKMVRTPEQRANYAASKMGDANPMKRHDVRLKSALGHSYPKSLLEEKFDVALSALGFEARYTGNTGTFVIGDDKQGYRLPDFKLPGKKVIEIYDTNFKYYKEGQRTKQNYEGPIRRFYKKFGYDCLFLTNKDLPKVGKGNLADLVDFKPVKEKVGMFLRNGARIISVRPLRTSSLGKYRNANGKVSVVNFSCKPYNTFLVGGLHVHNCDTSFQYDHGQDMSFDAILERMERDSPACDLIVVTGGEPSLQSTLVNFLDHALHEPSHFGAMHSHIQIESNGSGVSVLRRCADVSSQVTVVVSPKASAKGYGKIAPLVDGFTRDGNEDRLYFKYVVEATPESPHHTVPDDALVYAERNDRVFVSPAAVYKRAYQGEVANAWDPTLIDHERTARNYSYAAELVLKHPGLRLSIQQHLFCALA